MTQFKNEIILDADFARANMPERQAESNKGSFGKVLNIGGCKAYVGAAYLSGVSALKSGAGLVVNASCSYVLDKLACQSPNTVFKELCRGNELKTSFFGKIPIEFGEFNAIAIGCGIGLHKNTENFVKEFVETARDKTKNASTPIVYDADALNLIAKLKLTNLGENAILTPHPGEMARLMGTTIDKIQSNRDFWAKKAAEIFNSVIVLKGHKTLIASPDGRFYKDVSGTSILAKAGMGDVLTGITAALCAQGLDCTTAAALGVYIHSQSGCAAEKQLPPHSLLASELINFIPDAIASFTI